MSFIEDIVQKTLDSMSPEERHDLILSVVQHMMSRMSPEARIGLMQNVVDRFMDGLTPEEKQSTVRELVPRLLSQLMQNGNMNVDELLWAAMGSLNALDTGSGDGRSWVAEPRGAGNTEAGTAPGDTQGTSAASESSRHAVSE